MKQSVEVQKNPEDDCFLQLLHCAPVIARRRTSCTITICEHRVEFLYEMTKKMELSAELLVRCRGYSIFLVYDFFLLSLVLKDPSYKKLLEACGYVSEDLLTRIQRLRERMREYQEGLGEFPHELGVFLEYPIYDIEQFILHKGRDSIYTGYWKVYGDVAFAKERFASFDQAKTKMKQCFLKKR